MKELQPHTDQLFNVTVKEVFEGIGVTVTHVGFDTVAEVFSFVDMAKEMNSVLEISFKYNHGKFANKEEIIFIG